MRWVCAPRKTTEGKSGEIVKIRLELKVLADVGLLGKPNAGKSTLISKISSAKPKIADYPFTTLSPNLGVVKINSYSSFVVADIPGLISGASEGIGLGIEFLKHLSRVEILLHLDAHVTYRLHGMSHTSSSRPGGGEKWAGVPGMLRQHMAQHVLLGAANHAAECSAAVTASWTKNTSTSRG